MCKRKREEKTTIISSYLRPAGWAGGGGGKGETGSAIRKDRRESFPSVPLRWRLQFPAGPYRKLLLS